jgi:hypothetical protein
MIGLVLEASRTSFWYSSGVWMLMMDETVMG